LRSDANKIAREAVLFGDAVEPPREHVQLARHAHVENRFLAFVVQVGKAQRDAGELRIQLFDRQGRAAIDKDAVELVQKVVAGGAGRGPGVRQLFVVGEDLFDDDVRRPLSVVGV
jgi:hypothetical protein